jgi:hypothetical protein
LGALRADVEVLFHSATKTIEQKIEATYWDAVKYGNVPGPIAGYLERYPNGANAALAKALIGQLEKNEAAERSARDAEQKRLEAELKRLEEARKVADAARVEALRQADEVRTNAEAHVLQSSGAGSQAGASQDAKERSEREHQLQQVSDELRRTRKAAEVAEAERLAALREAQEALKSAEAAKAAATAEAKRSGGTKLASLPNPEARPCHLPRRGNDVRRNLLGLSQPVAEQSKGVARRQSPTRAMGRPARMTRPAKTTKTRPFWAGTRSHDAAMVDAQLAPVSSGPRRCGRG